jgi:hypothetical protein
MSYANAQQVYTDPAPLEKAVRRLRENINNLSPNDQKFAMNMLSAKRPSEKQAYWIFKMADKACGVKPIAPQVAQPNFVVFLRIVEMMTQAKLKLKNPKILFAVGDDKFKLSLAGWQSRMPGTINVTSTDKLYADRDWYGRINLDGVFMPSNKIENEKIARTMHALKCFCDDPAHVAKTYGNMFNSCCFCGLTLTNKHSVLAGYGPICAENFGLPWGK